MYSETLTNTFKYMLSDIDNSITCIGVDVNVSLTTMEGRRLLIIRQGLKDILMKLQELDEIKKAALSEERLEFWRQPEKQNDL